MSIWCGHCGTEYVQGEVFGARKARFWASSHRLPRVGAYPQATVISIAAAIENFEQGPQTDVAPPAELPPYSSVHAMNWCHSGPGLDRTATPFEEAVLCERVEAH